MWVSKHEKAGICTKKNKKKRFLYLDQLCVGFDEKRCLDVTDRKVFRL